MRRLLFSFLVGACTSSYSQDTTLTQGELNRVLNNAFNKLVSSNPNPGEIANYVTLDPINATFSVKGTIPLKHRVMKQYRDSSVEAKLGKDPGNISYLSLSATGGLTDKSYGVLFSNSSLNAGITLSAQYNFRIGTPKFSYFSDSWQEIAMKRDLLFKNYYANRLTLETTMNESALQRNRYLLELQQLSSAHKLQMKQAQLDGVQKTIDSLGTGIIERPGLSDTLIGLNKEIIALKKDIQAAQLSKDSINLLYQYDIGAQKILQAIKLREKLKADYDTLLTKATLQRLCITWFTLIGGYTRTSINTFDLLKSFDAQIGKKKLDGYNYGVAFNHLFQDRLARHTLFVNGSVSRLQKSNLALLSTTSIEQSRKMVNAAGDTIRTITNKYNAYTSPVQTVKAWNLSGHVYYLFSKANVGFHLFPSVDFQDNQQNIANLTTGFLISFLNTVKDQPVVNSELYIRFNDLFDEGKAGTRFFKRNEIGISFTIPFNIF